MSISPTILSATTSPKPERATPGIQFGCGRLISRVSSIETILDSRGINKESAFNAVVLPLAVPPANNVLIPFSTAIHIYAIISDDIVLNSTRSGGEKGSSRNLRMVKVEPLAVISSLRVI